MKRVRGFTLLELMVVVAIVAILAAVAITSYSKQVRKGRRAEAKQLTADYALREVRLRANSAQYENNITTLLGSAPAATNYYTMSITTPSGNCDSGVAAAIGNSFMITSTAKGDQTADTLCTPMTFTNKCGLVTKAPTDCW